MRSGGRWMAKGDAVHATAAPSPSPLGSISFNRASWQSMSPARHDRANPTRVQAETAIRASAAPPRDGQAARDAFRHFFSGSGTRWRLAVYRCKDRPVQCLGKTPAPSPRGIARSVQPFPRHPAAPGWRFRWCVPVAWCGHVPWRVAGSAQRRRRTAPTTRPSRPSGMSCTSTTTEIAALARPARRIEADGHRLAGPARQPVMPRTTLR